MGSDWVARKATCNVGLLLAELADQIQNDIDEAKCCYGFEFQDEFSRW